MTRRLRVSVFDEAAIHDLRKGGYQEVGIERDAAGHEFLILVRMSENFVRDAAKQIGPLGGTWMMHGETGEFGAKIGLNFFEFYALGRGGVLGDVDADAVIDAFYFFEPNLVRNTWNTAKEKMSPAEAATNYSQACADWGRKRIADVEGLDEFTKLAERVIQASEVEGALFRGWKAMPLPDDAPGRAMLLLNVLREMRGGAHIQAVKELGLDRQAALATNSPHMYQLFGWTDEPPTAARDECDRAEDRTDELLAPAFAVLTDEERERFASVVGAVIAAAS